MEFIIFETTVEDSVSFIDTLYSSYWTSNKEILLKKEHNCNVLMKDCGSTRKFIVTSTNENFTSNITSLLKDFGIDFNAHIEVENTDEYEFILSKEIDQQYIRTINEQQGSLRMDAIRQKYLDSHLEQFKDKLESVINKIRKYEFEFSFLIATSYLEELINEAFRQCFELKKFEKFKEKVNTSLTLSFKIEFLHANNIFDEKTSDVLNHIRKIRNHLAHQSIIEESHSNSIDSHIKNIEKICDNGILSRPESIMDVTDERLKILIPVIENLCIAIIGTIHFVNPYSKIGEGVRYANKGYGRGFFYTYAPEYVSENVVNHLTSKYRILKLEEKKYNKYGFNFE